MENKAGRVATSRIDRLLENGPGNMLITSNYFSLEFIIYLGMQKILEIATCLGSPMGVPK